MKPIFIPHSRLPGWVSKLTSIQVGAVSFAFWVFSTHELPEEIKRHETIHFYQQLELLMVFQWLLYGVFHLIGWVKYRDTRFAYFTNPFEQEAYENQKDVNYLKNRRWYGWIRYCKWPKMG